MKHYSSPLQIERDLENRQVSQRSKKKRIGWFKMSREWMDEWAPKLGAPRFAVLIAIMSHVGREGRAFPGMPRLAKMLGLNQRTVQRHVKAIEGTGVMQVTRIHGKPNIYRISDYGNYD